MGFGVWGLGIGVLDSVCGVWGVGCGVWGWGLGGGWWGVGFWGLGIGIWGLLLLLGLRQYRASAHIASKIPFPLRASAQVVGFRIQSIGPRVQALRIGFRV